MTRTRKIFRDVQIGNLTNELRKLEKELLEQEMKCYDVAEIYGTDSYQYETTMHYTIVIRAEIEDIKILLDEYLQAVC